MTEPPDIPAVKAAETYEQFHRRECRKLVGLAYVLSGSQSRAEDLAQKPMAAAYVDPVCVDGFGRDLQSIEFSTGELQPVRPGRAP